MIGGAYADGRGGAVTTGLICPLYRMTASSDDAPPASFDDERLVEAAARGDADAIAALYDRFSGLMFALARRMLSDAAMAEDLVHDVFVELWRHAATYEPARGSVRTWVLVRLRSRALDRLRSASVRREVAVASPIARDAATTDDPGASSERGALLRALAELPREQREVLELGYFEGLSAREIAERTGSPIGTVKSRTAAALSKLRAAMEEAPS